MASMLEKLGAMFEEGADTTSVSISADVSVSEGTDTEVVETVDEVQDYVEASDEVEAATQEVEEVTEQMEQTVEAAETAAELRANISQYGLNKQAAALIYQFYGIDKVGSFVTPSVEAIDTVGRNYNAANQLMAALEEAEKGFKARVKAFVGRIIIKMEALAKSIGEFMSSLIDRVKAWKAKAAKLFAAGATYVLPNKLIAMSKVMTEIKADRLDEALNNAENDEAAQKIMDKLNSLKEATNAREAKITAAEAKKLEQQANEAAEALKQQPGIIKKFIAWLKSLFEDKIKIEVISKEEAERRKKEREASKIAQARAALVRFYREYIGGFYSWLRKKWNEFVEAGQKSIDEKK